MRIVVTGGSGRLGQYTVRELLAHGHEVLSLDRVPPANARCPAWVADLTRIGDTYQALQGAGGIVHLAAWQAPGLTAGGMRLQSLPLSLSLLRAYEGPGARRRIAYERFRFGPPGAGAGLLSYQGVRSYIEIRDLVRGQTSVVLSIPKLPTGGFE